MHDFSAARIKKMIIHYVGSQAMEDNLILSDHHVRGLTETEEDKLLKYFLKSFQTDNYQVMEDRQNTIDAKTVTEELFLTSINFIEASKKYAEILYGQAINAAVLPGELIVVQFEDVFMDGEEVDAIGLFKSERKDTFMQLEQNQERYGLELLKGIDLKRLDKACIIFNVQPEEGFRVLVHDHIKTGDESKLWKDEFLGLASFSGEYAMTENYMSMCKSFVMEQIPNEFEVDRTAQIELLNRSSGYFEKHEEIDTHEYAKEVLEVPELMESFSTYKDSFSKGHNIEIEDRFEASKPALKTGKKFFKSVLKLDKNFHIYVHGNPNNIEQGYDEERGMKFYKVYYSEER